MEKVEFYIRKGSSEIRRWVTQVEAAPDRKQRLEIQLRQMPAQGWAALSVGSAEWDALRREPIRLDWTSLEPDQRGEAVIFATLQPPRPAVPERVRYDTAIRLWRGSLGSPGLSQLLDLFRPGDPRGLPGLVANVRTPYSQPATHPDGPIGPLFPVSTDGDLPAELGEAPRQRFMDTVVAVSDNLLRNIANPRAVLPNNDALRFLTWIFAACPPSVQSAVMAAFEAILSGTNHPLLEPPGGRTVVIHALGRITADRQSIERWLPKLADRLPDTTLLAPLAAMLSRPKATPSVLATMDVEALATRLAPLLRTQHEISVFAIDYKYALTVVAGLLRVREHDHWALMSGRSEAASRLSEELKLAAEKLSAGPAKIRGAVQKLAMTQALINYLDTNEGRPDILTWLDELKS